MNTATGCAVHVFLTAAMVALLEGAASQATSAADAPYLTAVRAFADTVLDRGRDVYGPQKTPLFVDGLHAQTLQPARWQRGGETWVLSNFASQQPLLRSLDGLTALTGEPKYRQCQATASARPARAAHE